MVIYERTPPNADKFKTFTWTWKFSFSSVLFYSHTLAYTYKIRQSNSLSLHRQLLISVVCHVMTQSIRFSSTFLCVSGITYSIWIASPSSFCFSFRFNFFSCFPFFFLFLYIWIFFRVGSFTGVVSLFCFILRHSLGLWRKKKMRAKNKLSIINSTKHKHSGYKCSFCTKLTKI